ncbi:hypothetical protein BC937DRAFT_91165 [Endogone sp. FLAS-F59071]|nr:hypothetical protein BC937DRAFT_91165 [Endogone sp. FLAS-F59071]|eukprot:RUS16472.1 hypothetical protein BC937DRAFT_91165 [Endogone sp. FLAS-F59071]
MTKKHQSKAPAPAKVQQTLSSFFKPKSTEPAAPATTAPRSTTTKRRVPLRTDDDNDDNDHHSDVPNTKSHATKRPLSPDTRSFGSSAPLSPSKRTRSDSDGVSSFFGAPAPETPKTPKTETKMTQFVFSPQKANDSAAADARLEEKRQRHDQFVAKFGDPNGSTLANKRRAPKILEDEEDEEGAEGGENEEGAEAGKNEDDDDADNMDVDDDERLVRTFKKLRSDYSAPTKATAVATALSSTKKRSVGRASKADQNKYTPLEKQYMEIKAQYPDTLLVVEVGYKFKFFDEDARIASKILHIAHFTDHNFHVASIPTHRLSVHVRRLVHAGHKVGVVRQTETAALKAAGDNRSAPFTRCLTNLYTKGTFVEDMVNSEVDEDKSGAGIGDSNYLMCVVEEKRGGSGSDERVKLGIVAVQPSTGDIVYDSFDDGYMRSELETRVLHIQPCEMLLPEQLSKSTEKLVSHLALHRWVEWSAWVGNRGMEETTAFGDAVRIERMPEAFLSYNDAFTYVSNFYAKNTAKAAEEMKEGAPKESKLARKVNRTSTAMSQNTPIISTTERLLYIPSTSLHTYSICLAAMIHYLTDFGLEHVLQLTKYFAPFSSRSHMLLNGNTLANLEIYRNQTNYAERGSLLWVLDHTSTSFGRRLLRRWVGRPLIDVDQLNERVNAVEEILNNDSPLLQKARELLKQLPDLERGLCRIHYGKSSSTELLQILMALQRIADSFPHGSTGSAFTSPLLEGIFVLLPTVREDVMRYMDAIDLKAAEAEDKFNLFKDNGKYPDIKKHKDVSMGWDVSLWSEDTRIASVEIELQNHLKEVRKVLNKPSLMYVDVSQIEVGLRQSGCMERCKYTAGGSKSYNYWICRYISVLDRSQEYGDCQGAKELDQDQRMYLAL